MGKGSGKGTGKGAINSAVGEEKSAAQEVLIHGKYYDVTGWRHPGGSVIKLYAGKDLDATQAFDNFHRRSKKAQKFLASRPSRDASEESVAKTNNKFPGQAALLADFDQLTKDLEKEGFFKPDPVHIAYRLAEIVVMHAVGFYLLFNEWPILGICILGIVSGRCGWLMHEGGHYSLTGNIPVDRFLQNVIYGVGCGMSGGWWRTQHNKHHSMPQKHGVDPDLDTLPLVAFTEKVAKKLGVPMKTWLKMQGYMFPVITTQLVALGWQFFLHPRYIVRTKKWEEAMTILTRLGLWHVYVTGHFGFVNSVGIYLAYNWVGANYIFNNFAVSHTHLDVVEKDDDKVDWVRYSAIYTMNVNPGPFRFVSWWMSYLNYQIEHHLFPSMPQFRFPLVSNRVRALFEKHGLKYDSRDYITSMQDTYQNLHNVGADVFYG